MEVFYDALKTDRKAKEDNFVRSLTPIRKKSKSMSWERYQRGIKSEFYGERPPILFFKKKTQNQLGYNLATSRKVMIVCVNIVNIGIDFSIIRAKIIKYKKLERTKLMKQESNSRRQHSENLTSTTSIVETIQTYN